MGKRDRLLFEESEVDVVDINPATELGD
jgi:hypothetical protein